MAKKKLTPQEQVAELDKQITKLIDKRDAIATTIDPAKTRIRDNAKAKRRVLAAARQLVGQWNNFGNDGMYYHIKKVLKVRDDDIVTMYDKEVTFVVESDEFIMTDKHMIAFEQLKQPLYIRLLSPEEKHLTTAEVMDIVDKNLVSVIEGYNDACARHNHKPIKVKVGKKA